MVPALAAPRQHLDMSPNRSGRAFQQRIAISPAGHQAILQLALLAQRLGQQKAADKQQQHNHDPGKTSGTAIRIFAVTDWVR
jgi:hypothetical protein